MNLRSLKLAGLLLALAGSTAAQPTNKGGTVSHDHGTSVQGGTTIAPKRVSMLATSTFTTLGMVGIGTASPRVSLHVVGSAAVSSGMTASSVTARGINGFVRLDRTSGVSGVAYTTNDSPDWYEGTGFSWELAGFSDWALWKTDGTSALFAKQSNRYIGIGTSAPAAKLHVSTGGFVLDGNGASGILYPSDTPPGVVGAGVIYYSTNNVFMVVENNGTPKPIVDPPGNWTCTVRTGSPSVDSTATCSGNEKALSGGCAPDATTVAYWNAPTGQGWRCKVSAGSVTATANCCL